MSGSLRRPGARARALAAAIDAERAEALAKAGVKARQRAEAAEPRPDPDGGWTQPGPPSFPEHVTEAKRSPSPEPATSPLLPVDRPVFLPVSEQVEEGDLLVVDSAHTGELRRADTVLDPGIVAIAVSPPENVDGRFLAPVADGRYAWVKVDASFGAVRPGTS